MSTAADALLCVDVIDSHTAGMPTRVIVGGVGEVPGSTMAQRLSWFLERRSGLRTFLMSEPRGHQAMTGALLQTSTRADADVGVIWMEVQGCITACGHGAMGVASVLVATGRVTVTEPITTVRLDTPSGLVVAEVAVRDGRVGPVTITAPASSCGILDACVDVPGHGTVSYDLAYSGNHCVITDLASLGIRFERSAQVDIMGAGLAIAVAVRRQHALTHPDGSPAELRHVQLVAPGSDGRRSRHAMVITPGWFDRSPCGTGTAARMAQLHARGLLGVGDDFVNESFIGTSFTGRLVAKELRRGGPVVLPALTGRAFVTGHATLVLDPDDPLPAGFLI